MTLINGILNDLFKGDHTTIDELTYEKTQEFKNIKPF